MSTETLNLYDQYRLSLLTGESNISTATIKIALLTSGYVPAQGADEFWSDISANEVSGVNYDAGGKLCNNVLITLVAGLLTVDMDDPSLWSFNAGGFSNAQTAVVYIDTGVAATSRLIAYSDAFDVPRGNNVDAYAIQFSTDGVFTIPR